MWQFIIHFAYNYCPPHFSTSNQLCFPKCLTITYHQFLRRASFRNCFWMERQIVRNMFYGRKTLVVFQCDRWHGSCDIQDITVELYHSFHRLSIEFFKKNQAHWEKLNVLNKQIKEQVIMLINTGVYKPGDKLPSIRNLSNELNINVNTYHSWTISQFSPLVNRIFQKKSSTLRKTQRA